MSQQAQSNVGDTVAAIALGGSVLSWTFINGALQCLLLLGGLAIIYWRVVRYRLKAKEERGHLCDQCIASWPMLRQPPGGKCPIPRRYRPPVCPLENGGRLPASIRFIPTKRRDTDT